MTVQTEQAVSIFVRAGTLVEELRFVAGGVEKRTTIPILNDVLLRAEVGALVLVTTNLDTSSWARCPAVCEGTGAVAVSAETLRLIVQDMVGAYGVEAEIRIEFDLANTQVTIASGAMVARLAGRPAEDWPTMPVVTEPQAPSSIGVATLARLARQIKIAITAEETRFQLNRALLEAKPGIVTLVATDGHRLLIRTEAADVAEPFTAMLWRTTLHQIQFLAPNGGEVKFWNDEKNKHHAFRCGERIVTGKTIEVNFPNYREVIADDLDIRFSVDVAALSAALRSVGRVDHPRDVSRWKLSPGRLEVNAKHDECEVTASVEVQTDRVITFGLNSRYVAEWLEICGVDRVGVWLKDDESQVRFVPMGDVGGEHTYVVMPLRLAK